MSPVTAAIALGSNLGDRRAFMEAGFRGLDSPPDIELLARAEIIESLPLVPPDPNLDPGGPYLNSVAIVRTTLAPAALLKRLHQLESESGRVRVPESRWGPRTLDLDLLLYGDESVHLPGLTVPHPGLQERLFVLEPLAALAPGWIVPTLGKSVSQCLAELRSGTGV